MGYKTIILHYGNKSDVRVIEDDELLFHSRRLFIRKRLTTIEEIMEEIMEDPLIIKDEKVSKEKLKELIGETISYVYKK